MYPDKGFSKEQNAIMHDLGEVLLNTITDNSLNSSGSNKDVSTKDIERYE